MFNSSQYSDSHSALQHLIKGLSNPSNHYLLKAHHYEHQGRIWYLAVLNLHLGCAWNLKIEGNTFHCDILLNGVQLQSRSRIAIPNDQVWYIAQTLGKQDDNMVDCLYYNKTIQESYPFIDACSDL